MVKRVDLPSEALDDICTLLSLSALQLTDLEKLFTTGESAFPLRETFVNEVAETLRVNIDHDLAPETESSHYMSHTVARTQKWRARDVQEAAYS